MSRKVTETEQTLAFCIEPHSFKALANQSIRPSGDWEGSTFGLWRKQRNNQRITVLQVNLHHNKAASAALCVAMKPCDVALTQEPRTSKETVKVLKQVGAELNYSRFTSNPRNCILIETGFQILPVMHHSSRDFTAVKIQTWSGGGSRQIILWWVYLPYYDVVPLHPWELEKLVMGCRAAGTHVIIGCDANSHNTSLGSTNTNNRCESLFNYIMANGLIYCISRGYLNYLLKAIITAAREWGLEEICCRWIRSML